jgi:class 3 adenylate cyclase/tetratricopeptide (TPR) repeat protein
VNCSVCGTQNPPGVKFCAECGSRLGTTCASCGATVAPGAKFCGECGAPVAGPPLGAVAPRPDPGQSRAAVAERRVVSVLFADIVGFTTLAEGRDAEDTRELLSRYFELSREVIDRYGGTVEKFIGDAVMAVWGAPAAHEDDAERAVRAALDLVHAVKSLGPGIQARAGVLTGEAAVTLGATNQGMVAGDLVNTASRLQSAATPGTVLVGEATQRAASAAITFEAVGERVVKGKSEPVPAWRALRVVAQVGGRNRSETLEAPFVGRDDQLRLLKDLFHAIGGDRRARLVSVVGTAGIGKSRLAWEFRKYEDGLVEPVWFHDGRSPAYGEGISFWALGEMIRRRAGLLETDDEATTRAKIAETVATHIPDADERRWIESAFLVLLGIETAQGGSEQLFAAWRTFFERMALTAPVVLIFEDFHHADSGLIDFVDHLMEWSRSAPIFVVTLARPELLERRPDWGAGKRNFISLYLDPLPESAMHDLLAGLVPGLPASAVRAIIERAGGIPLYAVETVRMLVSEGRLRLDEDRYVPVGDLTELAVPETLTALIASRLDRLPPDDRALVSDAAVLGQSFTLSGLSAVSESAPTMIEPRLVALVRRELLTLESDPRSPERGQYSFVQALIREVAYNTLAKRERKARHLAAARYFETLDTDEIAGALAGHYLAAHENATEGPEAEALAGQARIALRAAAERAIALGSYGTAATFYEQTLTVTTDPAEIADLHEQAGDAGAMAGHYEVADDHLRKAIEARRELGDRPGIARATTTMGRALMSAFRTQDAFAVLEPASRELADLETSPLGIALLSQLARAIFLLEDTARSLEVAERVLVLAERANLPAIIADTLVTRGTTLAILGRTYEGIGVIKAGRELAESIGLHTTVLRAINNLVFVGASRDPRAALALCREGLALARRLGVRSWIPGLMDGWAEGGLRSGEWDSALAEINEVMDDDWEPSDLFWLRVDATILLAVRGEGLEALNDQMSHLLDHADQAEDPQSLANAAHAAGFVELARGNLVAARETWRRSTTYSVGQLLYSGPRAARAGLWAGDAVGAGEDFAALEESGLHGPAVEADRRTIQAGLAALDGRTAEALALYRDSLRDWRELGLPWDEALTGIDMATLLDPAIPEVQVAATTAREILVRLRAVPFITRLDAALARSPAGAQAVTAEPEPGRRPTASPISN